MGLDGGSQLLLLLLLVVVTHGVHVVWPHGVDGLTHGGPLWDEASPTRRYQDLVASRTQVDGERHWCLVNLVDGRPIVSGLSFPLSD